MLYVKSVLAGIGGLIVASILYSCIYFALVIRPRLPQVPPGMSIGVDARVVFGRFWFWLVALLAFAGGFYWEFRRTKTR